MTVVHTFDSWAEYVDYACSSGYTVEARNRSSRKPARDHSWDLGDNWTDAVKRARTGWQEPTDEVRRMADDIVSHTQETLRDTFVQYHDVSGGEVDIGAYMTGEPECMLETEPVKVSSHGRVIRIVVAGHFSWKTDAKAIRKRGAAICALVECLERLQHSVEVFLDVALTGGRTNDTADLTYQVCLKTTHDVLDIPALMFAIAHPAAFRRIGMGAMEHENTDTRNRVGIGRGRGYGCKAAPTLTGDIQLDSCRWDSEEVTDGSAWIKRVLADWQLTDAPS